MTWLIRFRVRWVDGIVRIIHAQDWPSAYDYAKRLSPIEIAELSLVD